MKDRKSVMCPSCKKVFKVDDSVFTDIVKQVRDTQFQEEVNARLAAAEKDNLIIVRPFLWISHALFFWLLVISPLAVQGIHILFSIHNSSIH